MLNKLQILDILNYYNLPKNEYVIISGASMVLQGVKENTSDIDISVSEKLYDYLLKNYECKLEKILENNVRVWYLGDINFSTNFYQTVEYENINGYQCQTIEDILKLKKKLNRGKDLNDIKLLERRLS